MFVHTCFPPPGVCPDCGQGCPRCPTCGRRVRPTPIWPRPAPLPWYHRRYVSDPHPFSGVTAGGAAASLIAAR